MTFSVTSQQRDLLHKAVDAARNPGSCCYIDELGPACVIGQLAALHMISPETLRKWDERKLIEEGSSITSLIRDGVIKGTPLADYPEDVLRSLQSYWDSPDDANVKDVMKEYIKSHAVSD